MIKRKDYTSAEEMLKAVEAAMTLLRQNPALTASAAQILDKGMRMVYGDLFGNPRIKPDSFPGQQELSEVRRDADALIQLGGHEPPSSVRPSPGERTLPTPWTKR